MSSSHTGSPSAGHPAAAAPPWDGWRVGRTVLLLLCCSMGVGMVVRAAGRSESGHTGLEQSVADTLRLEGPITMAERAARRGRLRPATALTLAADRRTAARSDALSDASADGAGRAYATSDASGGLGGLGGLPFIPFQEKRGEFLRSVRLGLWPAERGWTRDASYANPAGFLVVTPTLRQRAVSRHFVVGDFAMRAGALGATGESYLVLEPALVRKLEAVIAELGAAGHPVQRLKVLSGFRAPSYNDGVEGAAPASRHQYGDAADVIADSDGDGRMDDLTGDGRVTRADIYLVADAVDRVERAQPALRGGLGLYDAIGPSGPFLHVDVRGRAARWGTAARGGASSEPAPSWTRAATGWRAAISRGTGVQRKGCSADAASAMLCATRRELQGR